MLDTMAEQIQAQKRIYRCNYNMTQKQGYLYEENSTLFPARPSWRI